MEHLTIKLNRLILVFAAGLLISLTSCYKDNEEELYPDNGTTCNTQNVSFGQTIEPIINNNCVSCHTGAGASGGIQLDNHATISDAALNGRLLGAIRHDAGFSAMPQGGNKLTDCEIQQFEAWTTQGALNN
jgi:uncharacterized membrane protein